MAVEAKTAPRSVACCSSNSNDATNFPYMANRYKFKSQNREILHDCGRQNSRLKTDCRGRRCLSLSLPDFVGKLI